MGQFDLGKAQSSQAAKDEEHLKLIILFQPWCSGIQQILLRLSKKLAALKFEEASLNIEKDIQKVSAWSEKFDHYAAQQALPVDVWRGYLVFDNSSANIWTGWWI